MKVINPSDRPTRILVDLMGSEGTRMEDVFARFRAGTKEQTLKQRIIKLLETAQINPIVQALALSHIRKLTDEQVKDFAPKVVELYEAICSSDRVTEALKAFGAYPEHLKDIISIFRG